MELVQKTFFLDKLIPIFASKVIKIEGGDKVPSLFYSFEHEFKGQYRGNSSKYY